jgi:hypothetical protein
LAIHLCAAHASPHDADQAARWECPMDQAFQKQEGDVETGAVTHRRTIESRQARPAFIASSGLTAVRGPSERSRFVALHLPQHPDQHRPERPILLAVDQQFGEGPAAGNSRTRRSARHAQSREASGRGRARRVGPDRARRGDRGVFIRAARGPRGSTLVPWLAAESRYASARDLLAAAVPCGHYSAL